MIFEFQDSYENRRWGAMEGTVISVLSVSLANYSLVLKVYQNRVCLHKFVSMFLSDLIVLKRDRGEAGRDLSYPQIQE
jgi:hypothetical protein